MIFTNDYLTLSMNKNIQSIIRELESTTQVKNITPEILLEISNDYLIKHPEKKNIHQFLNIAHLNHISKIIANSSLIEEWINNLSELIKLSNYHLGYLIAQRSVTYKNNTVFKSITKNKIKKINYSQLWSKIQLFAKSISSFEDQGKTPVIGLLTPNHLNGALIDLTCLSFGFRIIPIPLNITSSNLSYIITHSEITHLFIGGKNAIKLWNEIQSKHDIKIISLFTNQSILGEVIDWESFNDISKSVKNFNTEMRLSNVSINDTQTIMYTSGTTSRPKGIIFNQLNIIIKRFSRAIALPNINSDDIFLSYLPLFHTFGRYFELTGSIFWGSTYVFAQSPSFNSLLQDFTIFKPTIFISIPKRWVQLYDLIEEKLDLDITKTNEINIELKKITGGKLKWGLSAAGYLDPDIFIFFNNHGINMLSGYGMTEATGGITMTPVGSYIKNSVGKALPGIKLKINNDGELSIKGNYVSKGYYKEYKSKSSDNNWFQTGDIFETKGGHYFIIDRKKDIYKNSRGQTISPQKIENLFQDFD